MTDTTTEPPAASSAQAPVERPRAEGIRTIVQLIAASLVLAATTTVLSLFVWSVLPYAVGWQPSVVMTGSMEPAIKPGDVVVTDDVAIELLRPGHVIRFVDPGRPRHLLHRIVGANDDGTFITRGDANASNDSAPVPQANVVGVARLRVPYVGLPAVWLNERDFLKLGLAVALIIGAAHVLTLLWSAVTGSPPTADTAGPDPDASSPDTPSPGPSSPDPSSPGPPNATAPGSGGDAANGDGGPTSVDELCELFTVNLSVPADARAPLFEELAGDFGDTVGSALAGLLPPQADLRLVDKHYILRVDPPELRELRGLASRTFEPRMVAGLPRIIQVTDELLDDEEAIGLIRLLLAGHGTAAATLGNALLRFAEHRRAVGAGSADPKLLLPGTIGEMLHDRTPPARRARLEARLALDALLRR